MMQWFIRATCPEPVIAPQPLPRGVAIRQAGWLPSLAGVVGRMRGPAAAVTLGRTIIVHPAVRVTEELLRHELEHVKQWQEYRWTFPVRYVMNHLRYGYFDNPFEVEARRAERAAGSD